MKIITNIINKLFHILYNLKQFSCFLYKKFSVFFFLKLGLRYISANNSIFVSKINFKKLVFNVFKNDIKRLAYKKCKMIKKVKL